MKLYIELLEYGERHQGRSWNGVKEVPWTVPPPKDEIVFVGRSEDGNNCGINAHVLRLGWYSDGTICVETQIRYARDEYDELRADLVRDGFVE